MNWKLMKSCSFIFFFVLIFHQTVGFVFEEEDETNYLDFDSSNLVVDQTSKNKVENLGFVLKKHIHLLRRSSDTQVDLIFLIDSSASVGRTDFQNELKFVRKLLSDFTVDNNHTKISVITFSSKRFVLRQIDYITPQREEKNKCTLIDNDLPKIRYKGGGTYTRGAFREAKKVLQSARPGASKAIFLITDGFSNGGDPRPEARRIRESGVKIFTVGIAKGNKEELWDMSSEPKNETCYILDSFEEFESLARRALHEDLGRGDFIPQQEDKCNGLCFKGYNCCDKKASCKCGTYTGTYECICRPGHYGTGLKESCKPCPPGTYKAIASPGDATTCTRCPDENHTTFKGSVDLSQCVCKKGFRDFKNTGCVAMRCPVLASPKNGYFVNDKCDNVFNAACGIRCKPGYYLKGSSLRICQEGGSWSGRTTECIMKTCPALPRPKNGNMICDKDGFSFSTVCRFTCDTGYKLVGSRKRECLAIAAWTGINTRCREITCRPLPFVKDGKIYPSACTKDDVLFGTTCQISCYHGYSVVGPPIKQCTPDGMWVPSADGEMTHCDDTSPPIMKCPRDIETEADADDSSAEVVWQPPVALDNSGIRPIVTVVPAIEPPKRFPIGFTKVKYVAEDLSGNKVKCTFTVHVKDITPPLSDRCVSPFPFVTSEQYANVTWDEPEFSDNSGTIARVERNIAPGLFPQGQTEVIYTAFDEHNNNNTCLISVNVLPHPCQYPAPPVNGERECFETDEGVHCKVYCLEGYAFAIPPADDYFCAYDHKWRPEDKLPIPDCSVETSTNSVIQPASVTYIGTVPCRKQILVNEIENVFHQKVTEKVESMCGNNIVCEVDNIQTTCEEDKDFNKIKLVFNSRNKRSIWRYFRTRRAPKRHRRRKKTFAITFDFTVKGEMKKYGTTKSHLKNQDKLERSMERILGNVKEEATEGTWDLKMDGKVMMQFANISYDAEDNEFECEPGSILVNTSCIQCPVGTLYNVIHQDCQSCPQGSYQPIEGQVTCLVCPHHTSTSDNNSRSRNDCKELCLPGTFSEDGLEQCTTCQEGFYQNRYGQMSCTHCPDNTTTYRRGVRRPSMCRAECSSGYVSKTGLEPCLPCPKGTYQSDVAKSFCLECPGGGKTTDIGSTDITDCEGTWDYQSDIQDEIGFNECFGNLCQNMATCQSRGGFGFDCICAMGFTGVYCEKELDECESEPCLNGGTCVDLKTGYSCKCADGYTGAKCEVNIDECLENSCVNNGTCVDEINGFNCSCTPAYEGVNCERLKDDCINTPCLHNGTCVNTIQGYDCQCVTGYSGVDCEINEDDCASGPCLNDAVCTDGVADYKCDCLPGFTGKQCETDIDECLPSPCATGSTCVNQINSFTCLCPSTFSGRLCDTELDSDYMLDFPTGGTVNYASFPMNRDLTSFTIAFWIKTSDEINQGTPFSYSVGDFDNALTITNYDGFVIYVNNKKMNTDIDANDGTWHHVLVTWSSNRGAWKMYKNALLWDQGYNLAAGETIKGGGKVVIGQEQDAGGAFSQPESFVGLLTNLNLWSKELTFTQIEHMIVTCDKVIGDVIAWPDVQSGVRGDLQPNPSGFCRDCPIPSKPLNSHMNYNGTKANDIANYSCLKGYNLAGQTSRRCLKTSEWENDDPTCLRVDCGFPGVIRNGYVIGNSFSFDNRVRYRCNAGYRVDGNITRYCNELGYWEGSAPICEEIKCILPILSENTRVSNSKEYFRPGAVATFSCTTGNRLYTEHDSVTCQRDGTWDRSVPTCDPQTCKSPPSIQHGGYEEDGDSFSVGFMIQYSCDYGYKWSENNLNQKDKIQCLPSGEWERSLPECLIITCRTPPIVSNSRRTYSSLELLSTVEYECERGFNMNGENTLECHENGLWDPVPPDCDPVDCGPAESPPNAVATTGITTFGNTVTYQCKPGYDLNSATRRTCLENGTWSGIPPRCLPVSCRQPENIEHATRIGDNFLFMNTIHYRCDPGYNLIGESTRRCTGTGAWTSNIPSCIKLECPPPINIDDGYYTPSDFYYENIVTYQCEVGYYIKGNASIQCLSSGQWSPLSANCEPVLCPVLIVPNGGNITSNGRIFRSMATFSCNEGYTMDGETIRICQPEGYWSGISPTCTPVTCPVLAIPDNGNITTTGQTFGSYATYSCYEGYNMVGENIRICQPERYWSASSPTCESVLCPTLAIPDDGNLSTTGQTFSSMATYSCNDGYRMNGESIRICQPEGYWSGNAPSCTPVICPALNIPGNGKINITGQTFGSMAIYSCNNGYTINGETTRICQSEGSWSGVVPICEIVLCPALTLPDNGRVESTDETFNSIATYSCENGYTLEGEHIRTCQADQTWSGVSPVCTIVLCPALTMPVHGSIITNGLAYGSMATYSCNTGYTIEGENIRNCQSVGDWSGIIPTCNPVICPALTIPENGNLDTSGLIFRSTATYSCNVGYTINGDSTRLCQSDRNWSGLPPICEPVLCPVLLIPDGGKIVTTGQLFNSVAIFSCKDGYHMNGEAVRRCNSEGQWSGISPICDPVLCPMLAIPDNGHVVTNGQTFRSVATYTCNAGYMLIGEDIRICQSEGQWSNRESYCEPVRCPELTIPHNGSVETTGLTFLSVATYLCNDGYTMAGTNSANCQADGNWSSSVPKCNPVLCPEVNLLDYGTVSVTGQTFLSVATYSCNDGYIMEGEEIRTCLAEGIWSDTVPKCISTTCVPPSTIRNGEVNYKDLHIESVVFYVCDDGFRLIGDDVRRCRNNLTWSGFQPSCVVINCQDLPQIANGQQSTTGLVYNSVASFECDRGYELQGTDELICTNTGEWSAPLPSCSAIECETPGRIISNGRMFGDLFTVGSVISYECDIGYNLQGSSYRTCLSTGHWNETIPVCEIVRCNPPRLSHGLASTFKNEYNTLITFSCNHGYVLFGPVERLCLANGNWSGPNPVCVKCNDPTNLENGFVSIDDEIATYGCIPGYHLIGNNQLECQMDGSWINELPVCLAVECDDLEDEVFDHGNRTQTGYYFGDTSEYICEEGYILIGSAMRRCQTDGSWSGLPPACLIVRCPGTFEILNGRIEGDNVYGSTLTFTCDEGFRINGEYILTCLSTGSWSGTAPFCEVILCEQLSRIPYGSVSFNTLTVGSKAAYSCDQTYELIGDPIRECLNTARWSGTEPLCSQLECPPPNSIDHGTIIGNARTVGQVIRYNCDEGYTLQGISFRLCLHKKMWSGIDPMCVPIKCQSPSPLNHGQIVNLENEYKFGDIIQYECNEGYNLIGEAERECTSQGSRGRWSSIAPTCTQVSCGPPNDINNAVISILNDNSFLFGTMLSIECIDGYTSLSGKSVTSTCTSEGIWSVTFLECLKTQCPPLDPLINGNIAGSGFSFNDMVTFSCNDGFALKGPTSIKCLSTSRWSTAELPLCELITCPAPEQLANGFLRGNNYTFGNSIIYECNSGYALRGDRSRICLKNGMWSGVAASCSVVTCQLPEAFPNGQWNTSDVSLPYDSTIGFTCNIGYIPDKENKLLCSETGIWVGDSVSCSIIACPNPSQVLNGRTIYTDVTYNNEVDYICNDGYHLNGDGKLRCSETGAWDKTAPTCEPVNCGAPNFVAFSDIVGGIYSLGNTVTFICEQGYIIVGEAIRICTASGHWSGYAPLCIPITCDTPPDVDHAIRLGTDFTYQSIVIYACNTGYRSVGAMSLSCGLNGQWIGDLPLCEIVSCGPPSVVPSSNTIVTSLTYGSTVSYYCDLGYILHGDPIAMCNQNGQWSSSGNTTCLPVDCGRPVDILNGNVQYDSTTFQSTSTYSCNNMHRLTGESTLKCGSNGLWEGVVPFCDLTSCGTPIISSNVRVVGGGSFAIGETITYVCPEGHILVGNVKRNCLENGLWSGANPECLFVACTPIQVENAALKVTGVHNRTLQYEDVLHFECQEGYILQGKSRSQCLSNGKWSSEVPVCQPLPEHFVDISVVVCFTSQVIPNSQSIDTAIATGGTTDVQCTEGYQGRGNMTAVCSPSQTWIKPTGHCRRIFCGKPRIRDMVNVIRVQGSSYFYNNHVRFRCRPGVLPVKIPPVITCDQSGSWDGQIACSLPCKGGCHNGGRCLGLYGCKCPPGFGGKRCEKAYCILPCLNGGTCISPYLCSCRPGYQGTRCESPVCDRPCQYGGICIKPNMCHCKHGFRKPFCDHPAAIILPLPPLLVTLQPERSTTQSSNIIQSSFIQPTNAVDSIIHETDTTIKPFLSIREIDIPSRKTTTPSKPTTRITTIPQQPTTRITTTTQQPTTRITTTPPEPTTTPPQPTTRITTITPPPTTRKTITVPQPTTRRTTTAPQSTTRRPEYLDYVDVEFNVPDPS